MPSRGTGRTEGSRVGTGEADMALIVVGVAGAGRPGPRRGPGAGADVTWLIVRTPRAAASAHPAPLPRGAPRRVPVPWRDVPFPGCPRRRPAGRHPLRR